MALGCWHTIDGRGIDFCDPIDSSGSCPLQLATTFILISNVSRRREPKDASLSVWPIPIIATFKMNWSIYLSKTKKFQRCKTINESVYPTYENMLNMATI